MSAGHDDNAPLQGDRDEVTLEHGPPSRLRLAGVAGLLLAGSHNGCWP